MDEHKNCKTGPFLLLAVFLSLAYNTMAAIRCGPCGKTPVPYPMSTAPDCGDQAYKLKCDPTTSTLYFISKPGRPYPITSIDTKAQRLVIRPPSVLPGTCFSEDYSSEGFQIDDSLPFNISSSNTILLMNCTDNMLHLQVPINCSTNCPCHTYIDNTPSAAACKRQQLCCSFRTGGSQNAYIIRVHANGCMAYYSYVNFDPSLPFAKWPVPGLEIMYVSPVEPPCNSPLDCRDLPFSKCLADSADGGRKRCLCKKGRYWDPATGYFVVVCAECRHGTGSLPAATAGVFFLLVLTAFLALVDLVRYSKAI